MCRVSSISRSVTAPLFAEMISTVSRSVLTTLTSRCLNTLSSLPRIRSRDAVDGSVMVDSTQRIDSTIGRGRLLDGKAIARYGMIWQLANLSRPV